jgi:hypothetical protein
MADQKLRYVIEFDNASAVRGAGDTEKAINRIGESGQRAAMAAGNGIDKMTTSMTGSVVQAQILFSVIERTAQAGKRLYEETLMQAAHSERQEAITRKLAETHGMNAASVMAQVKAIEQLGYTDDDAMKMISRMIAGNIDLSRATEIATKSKNAGAMSDQKAGDAFEAMLVAAESGMSRGLRPMQIFVNLQKAITDEQKSLGRELTESERRQFGLNLILKDATKLNGTWEASMETADGQMGKLRIDTEKLQDAIGKSFQDDLKAVVGLLHGMVEWGQKNPDTLAGLIKGTTEFAGVLVATGLAVKIAQVAHALILMGEAEAALSVGAVGGLVGGGLAAGAFAAYNFYQDQEKYWGDQNSKLVPKAAGKMTLADLKKNGYSDDQIRAALSGRGSDMSNLQTSFGITVAGFEKKTPPKEEPGKPLPGHDAAAAAEKRAAEILNAALVNEYEGLAKVIREYQRYEFEAGKTVKARQEIARAFGITITKEASKELRKNADEILKQYMESGDASREHRLALEAGTAGVMTGTDEKQHAAELTNMQRERDQRLRSLEMIHTDTIAEQVGLDQKRAAIEIEYINRELKFHEDEIDKKKKQDLAYLDWYKKVYPEESEAVDRRISAVNDAAAEDRKQLEQKAAADGQEIRDKAALQTAEAVRGQMQSHFDSLKKSAGDVFDALLQKSSNVFSAIGNIFKTAILSAIKEVVSSRVAAMLMQMFYGTRVSFAGNGGMIANTPVFGGSGGSSLFSGAGALGIAALGAGGSGGASPLGLAGILGPGGTSGFAGPLAGTDVGGGYGVPTGAGTSGSGGGIFSGKGMAGMLGNLKGLFWNSGSIQTGAGTATTASGIGGVGGGLAGFASSPGAALLGAMLLMNGANKRGARGPIESGLGGGLAGAYIGSQTSLGMAGGAMVGAGAGLFLNGMMRGGAFGTLESTAGGAMIGMQFGGPLGAAIGAGVGLVGGIMRSIFGGDDIQTHTRKLIKSTYGVEIRDAGVLKQIVQMAQQGFGGSVSTAIRSPEIRKLIEEYAMATGQKYTGPASSPRSVGLAQSGGSLYQTPSYQGGSPLPSLGGSLPTLGAVTATSAGPIVVSNLSLSLNGQSAADALEGRVANVVTPQYVAQASMSAQTANVGRLQSAALQLQPSALIR